ncbi:MAG TPA: methyltransferase domain-containing protein [Solirubrobacteraceae bacterium]
MVKDPVHRGQLLVRRAAHLLQAGEAPETTRIDHLDEDGRARYYDDAFTQFAKWADRIEALTGSAVDGRRALDFGCGVGRIALPLAARCEHVYGLDISPAVLREAGSNAKRLGLENVEWLDAARLGDLSGDYDLVISLYVFQHIPSREGERVFAQLVKGLRPDGIGAIHVTIRPRQPLTGLARWGTRSGAANGPAEMLKAMNWSYPYMLMHSYSLNRLGRILADNGVSAWHARWDARDARATAGRSFETVTLFFTKD